MIISLEVHKQTHIQSTPNMCTSISSISLTSPPSHTARVIIHMCMNMWIIIIFSLNYCVCRYSRLFFAHTHTHFVNNSRSLSACEFIKMRFLNEIKIGGTKKLKSRNKTLHLTKLMFMVAEWTWVAAGEKGKWRTETCLTSFFASVILLLCLFSYCL